MKGFAIASKGIEETAALEIKELINAECRAKESCVEFEFKKFEELCLLCYKSQSADRIAFMIGSFDFSDFFMDFEKFIDKSDFGKWLDYKSFRTECIRTGNHTFNSVDVEKKAAQCITKKSGNNIKLSIRENEVIFLVYIVGSKCYFGIDFAGFELNKRGYKIFLHPSSLRGTLAYSLARESGLGRKEVMLDPFSRDGVIPIEAALYASGFSHNYYKKEKFAFLKLKLGVNFEDMFRKTDKKAKPIKSQINSFDHLFKYVDYSRKNAKIAGVEKYITFSRTELEWLDIKFKKESVDRIVTSLPTSKNADLGKIYNEFFYQSEYILKKEGALALITRIPELAKKHAEKHNFSVAKEKNVWSGEQMLNIIVLKRKIANGKTRQELEGEVKGDKLVVEKED